MYDAAACVSTDGVGHAGLGGALVIAASTNSARAGIASVNGVCSSKIVIDSAFFACGDFDIGPGAGYM